MTVNVYVARPDAPSVGAWLAPEDFNDFEEFAAKAREIAGEEAIVTDLDGVYLPPEGWVDLKRAWHAYELDVAVEDDSRMLAIYAWMKHIGVQYALYENGELVDPQTIIERFDDVYIGSFNSDEEAAEHYFRENEYESSYDEHPLVETLMDYVDWERYAAALHTGSLAFLYNENGETILIWRR